MGKDYGGETSSNDPRELQDLLVKRSSIKGQITKFRNFLSNITSKETLTQIELAELTLKLNKFESIYSRFDDLQNQIEVLHSENLSIEIDERDTIEQLFISNIAIAQSVTQKHNSNRHDESNYKDLNSSQITTGPCNHDHHDIGFKLPQIQVAKFDGSCFCWLEFRDTFLSLVHNNDRIAPIHKFHYLISYLTGDAARIIANLEVSSANYACAWNLLCDRYNNTRQLVTHHINSLLYIKPITSESDKSLRFLVDHINKNLRALTSLGIGSSDWDILLIHIMSPKLDSSTKAKWEEYRGQLDINIPKLQHFFKFLIDRADVLESINSSYSYAKPKTQTSSRSIDSNNKIKSHQSYISKTEDGNISDISCGVCNGNHRLYDCPTFLAKSVDDRIIEVSRLKLCHNCLRSGHSARNCRMHPCRLCNTRHNRLLHKQPNNKNISSVVTISPDITNDTIVNFSNQSNHQVLLSTAYIEVVNPTTNQTLKVRALLDCGSQSSFITQSLKTKLVLEPITTLHVNIIGIGNKTTTQATETCVVQLKSLMKHFTITSSFLVLPVLTGNIPRIPVDVKQLNISSDYFLADPHFHQPAPVDVVIGADIFWDIIGREQLSLGLNSPVLRSSHFGWLITGPMHFNLPTKDKLKEIDVDSNHSVVSYVSSVDKIHQELTKFWDLENIPQTQPLMSHSEKACETHFLSRTFRLKTGRFSVSLPLKDTPDCLGESYSLAKKRFLNLERRFRKQPHVKSQYLEFMREYADLGHLSESAVPIPPTSYFLCHHAVFKDSSESTKIRVVFDGSAPTSSGQSVNDILMVGPNMQDSLFSILIRARQHKFLLTGDVEKMYRQVRVHEEDRNLQLILWREDESLPIKTLQLGTVTYGMASSSYLSTRCLWQIGEESTDPMIKDIIQHDFFVDDLITGSESEDTLRYIHQSVTKELKGGCFNLRKFKTNLPSLFDPDTPTNDNLLVSESTSTLGMGWNPSTDQLHFPIKPLSFNNNLTKRSFLSSLFQIFDPLGLISPCVIKMKMLLQQLWLHNLTWDSPVPSEVQREWTNFMQSLPSLLNLEVSTSCAL